MNISRIRELAASGDMSVETLRYLIDCHGECEHLDFKEALDLDHDQSRVGISKDIVGMKNVGGGYIVIGVKDKVWTPVGIRKRLDYDTKLLREVVIKCTGLSIEVDLVQHVINFGDSEFLFG